LVKKPTRQSRPVPVAVVERLPRVPARVSGSLYNKKKRRRGKKEGRRGRGRRREKGKEKKKSTKSINQTSSTEAPKVSVFLLSYKSTTKRGKKKKGSKNLPELMGGGWLMGISFVLVSMLSCGARRKGRKRSGERNRG
jgi:hypothetical protein